MSNVKNYTEQGGEKTVIGGTLEITAGGQVTGLPAAAFQSNSIAVDVTEKKLNSGCESSQMTRMRS